MPILTISFFVHLHFKRKTIRHRMVDKVAAVVCHGYFKLSVACWWLRFWPGPQGLGLVGGKRVDEAKEGIGQGLAHRSTVAP